MVVTVVGAKVSVAIDYDISVGRDEVSVVVGLDSITALGAESSIIENG